MQFRLHIAESWPWRCGPGMRSVALLCRRLVISSYAVGPVGVDDQFARRLVSFARHHHICPGVFQHRGQIRHCVWPCVKILNCAEQACALPLPPVELLFEISSVAMAHGYGLARQRSFRTSFPDYERVGPGVCGHDGYQADSQQWIYSVQWHWYYLLWIINKIKHFIASANIFMRQNPYGLPVCYELLWFHHTNSPDGFLTP